MTESDLLEYVKMLGIPNFRGVKMRDELPATPRKVECGILNLNTHEQEGSHWTSWYKSGNDRYYFDSFGEPPPLEILFYLKTSQELKYDFPAIKCNAITVQHDESNECGALCLYILKQMSTTRVSFSDILEFLHTRYGKKKTPSLFIEV